jgi:hypothetical protein
MLAVGARRLSVPGQRAVGWRSVAALRCARPPHFLPVPHSWSVCDVPQQANRGGTCLRWGTAPFGAGATDGGPSRNVPHPTSSLSCTHGVSVMLHSRPTGGKGGAGGTCLLWGHGACRCRGHGRWGGGPSQCSCPPHLLPVPHSSGVRDVAQQAIRGVGGHMLVIRARRLSVRGPRAVGRRSVTALRYACPSHFLPVPHSWSLPSPPALPQRMHSPPPLPPPPRAPHLLPQRQPRASGRELPAPPAPSPIAVSAAVVHAQPSPLHPPPLPPRGRAPPPSSPRRPRWQHTIATCWRPAPCPHPAGPPRARPRRRPVGSRPGCGLDRGSGSYGSGAAATAGAPSPFAAVSSASVSAAHGGRPSVGAPPATHHPCPPLVPPQAETRLPLPGGGG